MRTYKRKTNRGSRTLDNVGYRKNKQLYTNEKEFTLESYLKKSTDIYYGLSLYETRKFAYEFAKKKTNKSLPDSCNTKVIAGEEWCEDGTTTPMDGIFCFECMNPIALVF
ncbi:hypothetical protein GWI33_019563 [Rhynchophorus ferrugineus]|uniref:Uncharacterized protein n=1 Tax=Rhynchophorus ferrugineus TaxID=354439 RepID=A0A834HR66_RHYFE|nr:hypothetical protein GWI33_019563 [Rhynchophorus ferrugineus]